MESEIYNTLREYDFERLNNIKVDNRKEGIISCEH